MAYIRGLIDTGREKEVPRWLIVSDFERIALHDLRVLLVRLLFCLFAEDTRLQRAASAQALSLAMPGRSRNRGKH